MACDLTTGLEALYKFSNDVTDSSGNGNDGTNQGGVFVNDKDGDANSAIEYNGSSTYTDLPVFGIFDGSSDFSISFWFYADSLANNQYFWSARDERDVDFRTFSSNIVAFRVGIGGFPNCQTGSLSTSTWYHIVGTYDASTGFELFVDKVSVDTNATTGTVNTASETSAIGRLDSSGGYFDGIIDELRIYSRKLDQDTIDALYDGYDAPTCGGTNKRGGALIKIL